MRLGHRCAHVVPVEHRVGAFWPATHHCSTAFWPQGRVVQARSPETSASCAWCVRFVITWPVLASRSPTTEWESMTWRLSGRLKEAYPRFVAGLCELSTDSTLFLRTSSNSYSTIQILLPTSFHVASTCMPILHALSKSSCQDPSPIGCKASILDMELPKRFRRGHVKGRVRERERERERGRGAAGSEGE